MPFLAGFYQIQYKKNSRLYGMLSKPSRLYELLCKPSRLYGILSKPSRLYGILSKPIYGILSRFDFSLNETSERIKLKMDL